MLYQLVFVLIFLSCGKERVELDSDTFSVTFLDAGSQCPVGWLVEFDEKDIDRLRPFLTVEDYTGDGLLSAINLEGTYGQGQRIRIRIRKRTIDEIHMCTTEIPWYLGVYVLEEYD